MEIPELPYTVPRVVKGRTITKVPAGSTMEKEVAKQGLYVEFFFHNAAEERIERIRVTRKLNRIKDPMQKLRSFNNLCEAYRIALEGGWNPLDYIYKCWASANNCSLFNNLQLKCLLANILTFYEGTMKEMYEVMLLIISPFRSSSRRHLVNIFLLMPSI